ncbi:MAG: hypothetical protein WCG84_04810 [Candidatus Moraniibacteriota bacterium]
MSGDEIKKEFQQAVCEALPLMDQSGMSQLIDHPEALKLILAEAITLVNILKKLQENKMMPRCVAPDYHFTPQQVLDATGRKQLVNKVVLETMPRPTGGGEKQVEFYWPGYSLTDDQLERKFSEKNWVSVDFYTLCKINQLEPKLAEKYPNATHWKNSDGEWCYILFTQDSYGPVVIVGSVGAEDEEWSDDWWFPGLPI